MKLGDDGGHINFWAGMETDKGVVVSLLYSSGLTDFHQSTYLID